MTTKEDLLYDEVIKAVHSIYAEEYDQPLLEEMIDEAIRDFLDNLEDIRENGEEYKKRADEKLADERYQLKDIAGF